MSEAKAEPARGGMRGSDMYQEREKERDVRSSNITAAKAVADAIRTSLGPRGMDKMVVDGTGDVVITNDGATILKQLQVTHPTAKMLVQLSHAQDVEAGDGTTTVVVLAGALLSAAQSLMDKGVHPTIVSETFQMCVDRSEDILRSLGTAIDLADREAIIKAAVTSLQSKIVAQHAHFLAPIAVDAVMRVVDPERDTMVDLADVRVVTKLGGTMDDTELVDGMVFAQSASHLAGGPTRIADAKIGLIQFCLSPPKADMESSVVVSNYEEMDRAFNEERRYLLQLCKAVKKTGCNVLLIQKSILQDAVTDLSLHFLAQMKIMVVRDIERDDIEFISKTLGCKPVAHIDLFKPDKLGRADLVQEFQTTEGKIVKITGVPNPGKTVSVLVRGTSKLVADEAERSLHDALCVVRSLVKTRSLVAGGGAPEMAVSRSLLEYSKTLEGVQSYVVRAYAEALEVIPYTLAENAGLHPVSIVTELRSRHAEGLTSMGINVKRGVISDMADENVVQPLLVSLSAFRLATETVRMILKIDDIVLVR